MFPTVHAVEVGMHRLIAVITVSILAVVLIAVGLDCGEADRALAAPRAARTGNIVSETVGPDGGVLTLTDGISPVVVIEVPPLAVTSPVTLVLERTFPPDHSPTPPWLGYSFVSFYLDAYRDGRLVSGCAFSRPVTVSTFVYDYYRDMGWRLFYRNDETERWEWAVETCDPPSRPWREPDWLHTPVCRASTEFAMLTAPFEVYMPVVER